MRINDWDELEEFTKNLLTVDGAKRPLNSGGTKKEEDVVSLNVVAQCKYTDNKNMSMLQKDLNRLKEASKLQDKLPLFINSNGEDTVVSIPVTSDTEEVIEYMIHTMCGWKGINKAQNELDYINDVPTWERIRRTTASSLIKARNSYRSIKEVYDKVEAKLSRLYDDLTMHDLFDQEN